ncbi:MAG: hypothetical protein ACTSW1_19110 [Candidatus Hodarchaeales archaeon]
MNSTKKLFLCMFLIVIYLSCLSRAFSQGVPQENIFDTYNLGIGETTSEIESNYTRFVALRDIRDYSIINFSVLNEGEPISSVTLQVKIANDLVVKTFRTTEKTALVETLSYQFELPQNLYIALNTLPSKDLSIEISVIIDPVIDWRESDISLKIEKVELVCFDTFELQEEDFNELLLLPEKQIFHLTPSKYTFLRKKIVIEGMTFVALPDDQVLECSVELKTDKIPILSVSVEDKTYYFNGENEIIINFTTTLTENFLSLVIEPDYESLISESNIEIRLAIQGRLIKGDSLVLLKSKHPIPEWIMLPILVSILFGLPYYYAYQDMLTEKDKEILD